MNKLTPTQPTDVIQHASMPQSATLIDLLRAAVDKGADVATLERLAKLYEAAEENERKKEFYSALSEAKKELRPIIKDKAVGSIYKYETFAAIAESVDPVLGAHDLFYSFADGNEPVLDPKLVTVCCRLSHRNGYYITATRSAPPDIGQNRNAIQAMGSTISYLQRYCLKGVLGLAVAQDSDGRQKQRPEPPVLQQAPRPAQQLDPDKPAPIAIDGDEEWQHWSARFLRVINAAQSKGQVELWHTSNLPQLTKLRADLPAHHDFIEREITKRLRKVK